MGPPHPKWMHDALGFLCAKAREIQEAEHGEFLRERYRTEERNRQRQECSAHQAKLKREARERQGHPERSIDEVLRLLVLCLERKFSGGLRILKAQLAQLLGALSRRLRSAFSSELRRLKARIAAFTTRNDVRQQTESIIEELLPTSQPAATGAVR